ncbi:MAG: hypothetical protein NVSMB66_6670 [Candidatus Doudnabacteria bacterium]
MKISFVIPAYNEEAYIGKCLESILKATNKLSASSEVIVVNNASTDRTKEIALSFQGVKVIDEPRKGITHARQAGFLASSGNLVANVDSDSILTPGWLEYVLYEFEQNPKLSVLSGPFIYYDLPVGINILVRFYYYLGYISYLLNRFVLRVGSLIQGGNFVLRRETLENIGGYNLGLTFYGEDTDLAVRISKVGAAKFTFHLPMYSSGRRLKFEGLLTMAIKYPINFFWTTFFRKPFDNEYIDVRPKNIKAQHSTTLKKLRIALGAIQIAVAVAMIMGSMNIALNETKPSVANAKVRYLKESALAEYYKLSQ